MSYLALARKWRPHRFEDVLGQDHVVQALSHALTDDKLHPAILLTGTRGVGKTTLARIIAKCLNCETGVGANPCGVCSACTGVDEGRFIDLLEIDAASNTGVDNVRELIENCQYAPVRGRYKVYLIDEVHMLSKPAFNALLKTLEEPPPHVKFILATTDPQKLPITVLSRCLQFNLKRMPQGTIRELLGKVLGDEKLQAEAGAIAEIARAADGSMRDALSLLDQAIAFAGGATLTREQSEEMLGVVGRRTLFEIVEAVSASNAAGLLACVQRLDAQAPDYSALLSDLAAILQRTAVLQMLPQAASEEDDPAIAGFAGKLSAEDVQLYYQIVILGRRDLSWAPDPRMGFEMTLLRLLTFRPDGGEARPATPPAGSAKAVAAAPAKPAQTIAKQPVPAPATTPAAAAPGPVVAAAGDQSWIERVELLGLEGMNKQLARNCGWVSGGAGEVKLLLDSRMKHLLQEPRRVAIELALSRQMGVPQRLAIEIATEPLVATPAQMEQQRQAGRQTAAEAAIENDPVIQMFKERFGATVRPGSIQPIE
jgi:DNA polymerase-3 subunit gamma/tau